ncbi:MAG: DUF348 domain-containing protein [Anaerolineae bacterium]|nr:DUF348 domain-containing protein [Anaerolineae bacterium]
MAVVLVAGALALLGMGMIQTGSPLVLEVDGQRRELRTHAATVGEALRRTGLELYPEDLVTPELEAPLEPDMIITVQCARPVHLHADGETHQIRTQATTVGQVLAQAGLRVGPADEILLDGQLVELGASLWDRGPVSHTPPSSRGGGSSTTREDTRDPPVVAIRRAAAMILDDDGTTATLHTTSETIGQVLQEHGVTLFLGDEVEPGLQERIVPGGTIAIHRSIPVQIQADGRIIRTRTRAETVAGALGQEGIALVGKDQVEPALPTPLRSGIEIQVVRVREELVVEFDPIPFKTEWVPDPEVEIDNIRLAREGQVGLTKRRFRVIYEDGREVERYLEDTWAEQPPITKTMAYGTKIVIRTMDTPDGPIEYWRKMRVYTTAYTAATCGKTRDHPRYGYTRLGWWLTKGIVAVDPDVIPLKTKMYVPGYGHAIAGDTGGGVKGKFVDLGYDEGKYQSWHWWTDIYLLTPVPPEHKILWILPDLPKFPDRKR